MFPVAKSMLQYTKRATMAQFKRESFMFSTMAYKEGYIHSSTRGEKETVVAVYSYEYSGNIHCLKTTCKNVTSAKRWISSQMKSASK